MQHDDPNTPSFLRRKRYITAREIAAIAEANLVKAEDMERRAEGYDPDESGCDSQPLKLSGVHLTMKEVRAIYDNLPPADKANVKAAALRFVALVKQYKKHTTYDFDDGLMDVARLGVFICA
jgi:hypothetical protein